MESTNAKLGPAVCLVAQVLMPNGENSPIASRVEAHL
jgi:hypothetical protein